MTSTGKLTWSQTAATNASADNTINLAEGQLPGSLNDSMRALMAVEAKARDDLAGVKPSNVVMTSAGSANAQTLTTNGSISPAALTNGWTVTFLAGYTNTSAATLAVDSLTAKAMQVFSGSALTGGEITAGCKYTVTYHQPTDSWLINSPPGVPSSYIATANQIRANTAGLAIVTDALWDAADNVALTDGSSIAIDLSTGWNFALTLLATGHTLASPSNSKNGQSGCIRVIASGGNYTLQKGINFQSAGVTWPITIQNGTACYIYYSVFNSTNIIITGVINNPS